MFSNFLRGIIRARALFVCTSLLFLYGCAGNTRLQNSYLICTLVGTAIGTAAGVAVDSDDEADIAVGAATGGILSAVLCGATEEVAQAPVPAREVAPQPVQPAQPAQPVVAGDEDGDGVSDTIDICPNTAPGTQVDQLGCPLLSDSDGDGIVDENDRCPNTPENSVVDLEGCPLKGEALVSLENVHFEFDQAALTLAAIRVLDETAAVLRDMPDIQLRIEGHTDNVGTDEYNQSLSERRARAAYNHLVQRGISKNRLQLRGLGEAQPIASNQTERGQAQNRRVEFVVTNR
ncbi:MAG: OmpA family protein [Gammaproteobacteria bacterium]|nr:OmpA family protein [Gammaproteobacteria bacterium]